ncbi:MAG: hypothetical protein U0175_21250 [Caldilineaceae bacterium]
MKRLVYLFYVEILINFVSIYQSIFTPAAFVAQFGDQPVAPVALEVVRWYGVLLIVLSYLLWRGLRQGGVALRLILEALLLGDIIQLAVAFATARNLGNWPFVVIMAIVLSVVLAVARLLYLNFDNKQRA